jgi:hypothetical protein
VRRSYLQGGGDRNMTWETPEFVEIKMDAEVSAYQQDI